MVYTSYNNTMIMRNAYLFEINNEYKFIFTDIEDILNEIKTQEINNPEKN